MRKWLKVTIGIIVILLVLFTATGIIFYNMLSSSLPVYNGDLYSEKIINDIQIYRDSMAVPYIIADSDEDAAFALGYVHAQERLFIMDIIRRAGAGRLSEVLGSKMIPFDRMFRTAGIQRFIEKNYGRYDPSVIRLLNAYSNGVNLFINNNKGKYPIEFDVLGYEPEEWKPLHSLIVIRMMAWELNISWWTDFSFTQMLQKYGEEKVKEILPDYPENGPYIIPGELKNYPPISKSFIETDKAFRNFLGWNGTHIGSNNWVVNGSLSASGKPIIANDPHLAYSAPGKWYAAVIRSKDWVTAGVSLPGVPGIVIGKNNNISWVLTNIMIDDADFYIEQLDSSKTHYMFNGSWTKLSSYEEVIKVKDSADVKIKIKLTHRGPIVSDIHPYSILYTGTKSYTPVLSMRWMGNEFSDEMNAFYKINKASNWTEFKNAVRMFSIPGQNFVYGDIDGNIGYVFGGHIPIRASTSPTLVYPGTTDQYDWKGIVKGDELPAIFNPPQNFLASANNKTSKNFKYHITNLWEPSSRMERVTELLTSKSKHSVNDYKKYQMDIFSPYAKNITPYIISAFDNIKINDKNLRLALELLKKWDYEMNEFSQVPAIYAVFLKHLLENVYKDEMGPDLFNEFVFVANIPYRSILQVIEDSTNTWIDDISTKEIESRERIIRRSLNDALTELEGLFGEEIKDWQWGKLHKAVFKHSFGGFSSLLDNFVNIGPKPIGGDGTTIFNTEYPFNEGIKAFPRFDHEPFENDLGPSMRFIYDFAAPDEFYLILTTGQSGHVMSDHYKDMSDLWLRGKYLKIRTDEASIKNNKDIIQIRRK